MKNMKKVIGVFLVIAGVLLLGFLLYINSRFSKITRVFSPQSLLISSWENYKEKFINEDGRVIDPSQSDITTSEGQSYALLRAVWIDDKQTFDKVWQFTKDNLKQPNDNSFGWRWGKREDGSFGFIAGGGENNATDADSDIALALILASRRWNGEKYLEEVKPILNDLWELNTEIAAGKRYLVAGNWAKNNQELVLNPSYFAPYAWRIFGKIDKEHDWESLIDPAYELLMQLGKEPLDKPKAIGLPPDWVAVNRQTGKITSANLENLTTNYSFDALRIPWRIALDYQWNGDKQALNYLTSLNFLEQSYALQNKLVSSYSHDGQVLSQTENPAMYSSALGYFLKVKPELAQKIYQEKIIKLYSNAQDSFNEDLPYYEQNWLWFGTALYHNFLSDFSKDNK